MRKWLMAVALLLIPESIATTDVVTLDHKITMTIEEVIRGEEANIIVEEHNFLNPDVYDGREWALVKVTVHMIEGSSYMNQYAFDIIQDNDGYYYHSAVDIPDGMDAELEEGESATGWFAVQVDTDHKELEIVYRNQWEESATWLTLE